MRVLGREWTGALFQQSVPWPLVQVCSDSLNTVDVRILLAM